VHAFLITWSCCHDSFCLQTKQYLWRFFK
jgi:hypothetical protein